MKGVSHKATIRSVHLNIILANIKENINQVDWELKKFMIGSTKHSFSRSLV